VPNGQTQSQRKSLLGGNASWFIAEMGITGAIDLPTVGVNAALCCIVRLAEKSYPNLLIADRPHFAVVALNNQLLGLQTSPARTFQEPYDAHLLGWIGSVS
jgi:hypothetical protein